MVASTFIFALIIAVLFSALLVGLFGWRHPARTGAGAALVFLFLILLLATWAGGAWMGPFGPPLWGGYWLPPLLVGVVILLIIAALVPVRPPRTRVAADEPSGEVEGPALFFGLFFWLLLLALAVAVVAAYASSPAV
ncbi:MAG: hypothetical protein GF355_17445 [Candidatus Eisenbacteria bacterium]|nr:hypothetical protein [Candidatus Eisenbacteria bacterium]